MEINMKTVEEMEKRFLEVSGLDLDLSVFPLDESTNSQMKVDKEKSDQFGEVFTPLWLVDKMILKAGVKKLHESKSTLDLCAGYGQFTIRMIRSLANYDPDFDVLRWLKENHTFIELQLESAYKILYVFGTDINLLIGDSLKIKEVIKWDGVNYFDNYWKSISSKWLKNEIVNCEETFVRRFLEKFKEKQKVVLTWNGE